MKTIPAALQTHYDSGATSLAHGLIVRRRDGAVHGFTSADVPATLDCTAWGLGSAVLLDATQGLESSSIVTTAGLEVDNLNLTTLDDGTLFDREVVLAGVWDTAEFRLFRYRWDVSPVTIADHVESLMRGWFGEFTLRANTVEVELRGLTQKLQQPVGIVSQKTCRARLGDSRCTKSLTAFTHTGTVTAVADARTFTASALSQAADYFGEGLVTFTSGVHSGTTHKLRSHAAGGVFTLALPLVQDLAVGTTFSAVAGCRKRLMEDCKTKFNNVLNFQGEPHRPTVDDLTKPA